MCSLHFLESDFETTTQDTNSTRRKRRIAAAIDTNTSQVKKARLKDDAVPSQWPGAPAYLSVKIPPNRAQSRATAEARRKLQVEREDAKYEAFLSRERVHCLDDVLAKLDEITLPDGVAVVQRTNCVIFLYIEEKGFGKINIMFHLTIFKDCSFRMEVQNTVCPNSVSSSVTDDNHIKYLWEISNILAILKNCGEKFFEEGDSALRIIKDFQRKIDQLAYEDSSLKRKIDFLIEQLLLAVVPKSQRKYSSDLLACAAMWRNTSPTLYNQILGEGHLTLPCVSWLKKLTSSLTMSFGLTDNAIEYLKLRIQSLSNQERKVILMFDEIYVQQKVEYSGGQFFGLQSEKRNDVSDGSHNPCKTVLCFHVASLFGAFQDMVAQYPIMNLDSSTLLRCYEVIMRVLHNIGFEVLILSSDNATSNRKFMTELCNGSLQESITHPYIQDRKLYLLFDPVHGFKNVFNNFQSLERFVCPDFDNFEKVIFPSFAHVKELFEVELGKPIKMAYKLTKKAISPKAIEKTNVMLAQSVFDDSTISAMEFYIQNLNKPWQDTLKFLKIINRWWKIVNVKTPYLHVKTKDPARAPIRSIEDENFQYLFKFEEFLSDWNSKLEGRGKERQGLTPQTMIAMISTTKALQGFAKDMLGSAECEYILLGKCQTDKIEARFGWFRQLSGGNYFISCRQILESDKLIRVRSLVKFSSMDLREVKKIFGPISGNEHDKVLKTSLSLEAIIEFRPLVHLQVVEDANVLYYVAGYLARSIARRTSCSSCKNLISQGKVIVPILEPGEQETCPEYKKFLHQINRGGLSQPTDLVFVCCVHAWGLYNEILNHEDSKKLLFQSNQPREVFSMTFMKAISACPETDPIMKTLCTSGHEFKTVCEEISKRIFNVFGKNFASERNSEIQAKRCRSATKKILKLQSKS